MDRWTDGRKFVRGGLVWTTVPNHGPCGPKKINWLTAADRKVRGLVGLWISGSKITTSCLRVTWTKSYDVFGSVKNLAAGCTDNQQLIISWFINDQVISMDGWFFERLRNCVNALCLNTELEILIQGQLLKFSTIISSPKFSKFSKMSVLIKTSVFIFVKNLSKNLKKWEEKCREAEIKTPTLGVAITLSLNSFFSFLINKIN